MIDSPFCSNEWGFLVFKDPDLKKSDKSTSANIAETSIEIFQAVRYLKDTLLHEFVSLVFKDPYQQHFVMFDNYSFPVRVITVGPDNVINNIYDLKEKSKEGYFIKSFCGFKMVMLTKADNNIEFRFGILKNHTTVELLSHNDSWYKYKRAEWARQFQSESDLTLIDRFNNGVGISAWGVARSVYVNELIKEIESRSFNSDIIWSLQENGLKAYSLARRVRLVKNRLEFLD